MRVIRSSSILVIALVGSILHMAPANAGVTATVEGRFLTIVGDDGKNGIWVLCDRDEVVVNGEPPDSGAIGCDDIAGVRVEAKGGDDVVDLRGLVRPTFGSINWTTTDAGPGDDEIFGAPVRDTVLARTGFDTFAGGGGADSFRAGHGSKVFDGGGGRDDVWFRGEGRWRMDDESIVRLGTAPVVIELSSVRTASWIGGPRRDVVDARDFSGALSLSPEAGHDRILGGHGPDQVYAYDGSDEVLGGPGRDVIAGSFGDDLIRGGGDDDRISGGQGIDRCIGGPGEDEIQDCEPRA